MTTFATCDLRLDADYALFSETGRKLRSELVTERFLTHTDLTSIRSVTVRPSELLAAARQIKALKQLPPDWDSYGARSVQAGALEAADTVLRLLSDVAFERPDSVLVPYHIAPSADGGLQIEWRNHDRFFELWIDPHGSLSALTGSGTGELVERQYLSTSSALAELQAIGD